MVRKFVAVLTASLYLAACGAPSTISGSTVKHVSTAAGPDAVEVADGAIHTAGAADVSHLTTPVVHPANRGPVTPVSRPAVAPPVVGLDRRAPGLNCQGFGGPGRLKPMCAPQ